MLKFLSVRLNIIVNNCEINFTIIMVSMPHIEASNRISTALRYSATY